MTAPAAPGGAPAISVIIPHHNDLANLERCLKLLGAQRFTPAFETIVVENGSSISVELIEAAVAGRARLVVSPELGAGPARNAGIAAARAPLLAFIDSDCRPAQEWLAHGYAALARADFAGGQVNVDVEDPARMTPVEAFEAVFAFRFKDYIEKKGFTGSGNLFARRAVFDAVGGFKAQVSEDVEWSHRARAAGFTLVYEPLAAVGHPARRSWAELERKWARMNREQFQLALTQKSGMGRFVLRSWAVLLSVAPHAVTILRAPALFRLRDRVGAIGVLARIRAYRFRAAHAMAWRAWRGEGEGEERGRDG